MARSGEEAAGLRRRREPARAGCGFGAADVGNYIYATHGAGPADGYDVPSFAADAAAPKINWAAIIKILIQIAPMVLPLFLTQEEKPATP